MISLTASAASASVLAMLLYAVSESCNGILSVFSPVSGGQAADVMHKVQVVRVLHIVGNNIGY